MNDKEVKWIVFKAVDNWNSKLSQHHLDLIASGSDSQEIDDAFNELYNILLSVVGEHIKSREKAELVGKSSAQRMAIRKIWQTKRVVAFRVIARLVIGYRRSRAEDGDITDYFNSALGSLAG